jgi:hypothetical protein
MSAVKQQSGAQKKEDRKLTYQGLALSILRSKRMHSMLGFLANASAAHAPEGPPPSTATLYLVPGAEWICYKK